MITDSEWIVNPDGSAYHLGFKKENVATTIYLVGDPDRIDAFLPYFSDIEFTNQKREFRIVTGLVNSSRISILSTGIGTDNIDIVINELDALHNLKSNHKTNLKFIRIGTSGALLKEVDVDSILINNYAIGLDNLAMDYEVEKNEPELHSSFTQFLQSNGSNRPFYTEQSSTELYSTYQKITDYQGIGLTCNGFYGPQGRNLRLASRITPIINSIEHFHFEGFGITNMEMETAGIYFLANHLGHSAISLNAILANRKLGTFSSNPRKTINTLIEKTMNLVGS